MKNIPKEFIRRCWILEPTFTISMDTASLKGSEYLISMALPQISGQGKRLHCKRDWFTRIIPNKKEKHWCINNKNPTDEFALTISPHPYNNVIRFQVSQEGVLNHKEIKLETDINPTYLLERSVSSLKRCKVIYQ